MISQNICLFAYILFFRQPCKEEKKKKKNQKEGRRKERRQERREKWSKSLGGKNVDIYVVLPVRGGT